jgi:uncharacterized protein (DUF1697 family)
MPAYAAFLRGVMPFNCKMPDLKRAFEAAGFTEVRTVLGSGNVVFTARAASESALEKKAEAAMKQSMGRSFPTIVRSISALKEMLAGDPYKGYRLKPGAKRVVTFLREKPKAGMKLPAEVTGARILAFDGREVFTVYVRDAGAKGPVFMQLIEKTFGKDVTTRTWETIQKIAK